MWKLDRVDSKKQSRGLYPLHMEERGDAIERRIISMQVGLDKGPLS